ncbi:hypothetical protein SELMODRAFT_404491 [Selaginella moellendorffii]|uniref:SAC domain-containing protein n=1 Tax=Selaginella moellendorffii TaxID=88036 RepID=D8QVI1_SELML|nr:hypothetical protein SELMODRAFT_404491 [Selaginella moellendorffii]
MADRQPIREFYLPKVCCSFPLKNHPAYDEITKSVNAWALQCARPESKLQKQMLVNEKYALLACVMNPYGLKERVSDIDLWKSFRRGMTVKQQERFADTVKQTCAANMKQLQRKGKNKERPVSSLEEYIEQRRASVAALPLLVLLEYTLNMELSDSLLNNPKFQRLQMCAMESLRGLDERHWIAPDGIHAGELREAMFEACDMISAMNDEFMELYSEISEWPEVKELQLTPSGGSYGGEHALDVEHGTLPCCSTGNPWSLKGKTQSDRNQRITAEVLSASLLSGQPYVQASASQPHDQASFLPHTLSDINCDCQSHVSATPLAFSPLFVHLKNREKINFLQLQFLLPPITIWRFIFLIARVLGKARVSWFPRKLLISKTSITLTMCNTDFNLNKYQPKHINLHYDIVTKTTLILDKGQSHDKDPIISSFTIVKEKLKIRSNGFLMFRNKNIRLVLMSATADLKRYESYFSDLGEKVEKVAVSNLSSSEGILSLAYSECYAKSGMQYNFHRICGHIHFERLCVVVKSLFGRKALESQLQQLGVFKSSETIRSNSAFDNKFKNLWADHGDEISMQYSGTPALKGDFVRYGNRIIFGLIRDGFNALTRYFNNFTDGIRQHLPFASAVMFTGITMTTVSLSQVLLLCGVGWDYSRNNSPHQSKWTPVV